MVSMQRKCLRAILICYKDFEEEEFNQLVTANDEFKDKDTWVNLFGDMTMLAICGLKDPLREGISDAVDDCHNAGITVRMCTGDNLETAIAISKEAHIIDADFEKDLEGASE